MTKYTMEQRWSSHVFIAFDEKKRAKMKEFCARQDYISPTSKEILQLDDNGNVIAIFKSAVEASKQTNTNHGHLCEVARGLRKRSGGFRWKYKEYNND